MCLRGDDGDDARAAASVAAAADEEAATAATAATAGEGEAGTTTGVGGGGEEAEGEATRCTRMTRGSGDTLGVVAEGDATATGELMAFVGLPVEIDSGAKWGRCATEAEEAAAPAGTIGVSSTC